MDLAKLKTKQNEAQDQFELEHEGKKAFIAYKIGKSGNWYLVHTEVPDEWEGQGVGHKLVRETLNYLEEMQVKIIPSCPFVKSFIKDHKADYAHIVAEGVNL
ncbi:MAG: GNAT family N-acetyltransferase [Ekhidna sp.]